MNARFVDEKQKPIPHFPPTLTKKTYRSNISIQSCCHGDAQVQSGITFGAGSTSRLFLGLCTQRRRRCVIWRSQGRSCLRTPPVPVSAPAHAEGGKCADKPQHSAGRGLQILRDSPPLLYHLAVPTFSSASPSFSRSLPVPECRSAACREWVRICWYHSKVGVHGRASGVKQ